MSFIETDILNSFQILTLGLVVMTLMWVSYTDLRFRLIKNEASLLIIGLFGILSLIKLLIGIDVFQVLVTPITVAAIVFAIMLGLFALNYLGGGDAKIISAFALIAGQAYIFDFLIYTALAGGFVAFATILHHQYISRAQSEAINQNTRKLRPEIAGDLYLASVASGSTGPFEAGLNINNKNQPNKLPQAKVPYGVAISISGFWVITQQIIQLSGG